MIVRCVLCGSRIAGRADRTGTAAVQFAVTAPVFLMLVFGLIELGRGLMVIHLLNNAARNGCRAGIIEGTTNNTVTSAVNSTLAPQGITAQATTITVTHSDGTTSTDVSTAQSGDQITVQVSLAAAKATWMPVAFFLTGNISGQYALRRE